MDNEQLPQIKINDQDIYVEATNQTNPYHLKELTKIKAVDSLGKDISDSIIINDDEVKYTQPGKYDVAVSAMDDQANIALAYLTVHVLSQQDEAKLAKQALIDASGEPHNGLLSHFKHWWANSTRHKKKRRQAPTKDFKKRNNNYPRKTNQTSNKKSQQKFPHWRYAIVLMAILISGISFYYSSEMNHSATTYTSVAPQDSSWQYNRRINVLINDLRVAVSNYYHGGTHRQYAHQINQVSSRINGLQSQLQSQGQHRLHKLSTISVLDKLTQLNRITNLLLNAHSANRAQVLFTHHLAGTHRWHFELGGLDDLFLLG